MDAVAAAYSASEASAECMSLFLSWGRQERPPRPDPELPEQRPVQARPSRRARDGKPVHDSHAALDGGQFQNAQRVLVGSAHLLRRLSPNLLPSRPCRDHSPLGSVWAPTGAVVVRSAAGGSARTESGEAARHTVKRVAMNPVSANAVGTQWVSGS